jgi:hypothetical protein
MAGLAHDAGIVAARCQNEGDLRVGEQPELVDRTPGRDVVLLGCDEEDRRIDVAQRDDPALGCRELVKRQLLEQVCCRIGFWLSVVGARASMTEVRVGGGS